MLYTVSMQTHLFWTGKILTLALQEKKTEKQTKNNAHN